MNSIVPFIISSIPLILPKNTLLFTQKSASIHNVFAMNAKPYSLIHAVIELYAICLKRAASESGRDDNKSNILLQLDNIREISSNNSMTVIVMVCK